MGKLHGKLLRTVRVSLSYGADRDIHLEAGNPAGAVLCVCTIPPGVVISQSSGYGALVTGNFAAGSIVVIINNGSIFGKGGNGGNGGTNGSPGSPGGNGGAAIYVSTPLAALQIDNTNGYVFGGGGGGGGGGSAEGIPGTYFGGGGGGGGQGLAGGAGGGAGTGNLGNGTAGMPGDQYGFGNAGAGGISYAGSGGIGYIWGQSGVRGGDSNVSSGGAPGNGGMAVALNGNADVTWLGGNNPSQVKGLVA